MAQTKQKRLGAIVVLSALLCLNSGCLSFDESPWDSSTLLGFLLQWHLSRQPFALGQDDPYSVYGVQRGFSNPLGLAAAGDRLLVADSKNKRILAFSLPKSNHEPALYALGHATTSNAFFEIFNYPSSLSSLDRSEGVATDGVRVAVADTVRNRVLVWSSMPQHSGQAADVVVGQPDPSTTGAALAQSGMSGPRGVALCQGRLYVADSTNHRVLIYANIPTQHGANASAVLGQADFVSALTTPVGNASLNTPAGIHCDGQKLYVADSANNRVLIWNTPPTSTAVPADVVVGQAAFNLNGTATTDTGMSGPEAVFALQGGPMAVADRTNNRALYYASVPAANGAAASKVFGQVDFLSAVTATAGAYAAGLDGPAGVALDADGRLYVADRNLHRVAVWTTPAASANGAPMDLVLGQPTPATKPRNNNPGGGAFRMVTPATSLVSDGRLFVADVNHSRVLSWSPVPLYREAGAGAALGQPNLDSIADDNSTAASASTLDLAVGVCSNGVQFFVSDTDNHRVLVWNGTPHGTQVPANFVIGQVDFTTTLVNQGGGAGPNTLQKPAGLYCDSGRLIVVDSQNHRVLFYNLPITANNASATLVLGQVTFTANTSAAGATGLSGPGGAPIFAEGKLILPDSTNNRVLIWNSLPTTNGQAADVVLGQTDFAGASANGGQTDASAVFLSTPQALLFTRGRLFVADVLNNRLMVWRGIPTANGTPADYVIGQGSFTARLPNGGGAVGPFSLFGPYGMFVDDDRFLISDAFNQRVLVLESRLLMQ